VLAGPPNAGKSSLFNALLGRPRALVADQPGTTRDYVEAELELDRYACVLVDTAGLREGAEAIEQAGVALSRAQVEGADVVLWIEAADSDAADDSVLAEVRGAAVIRVESKRDRGCRRPQWLGVSVRAGAASEGRAAVDGLGMPSASKGKALVNELGTPRASEGEAAGHEGLDAVRGALLEWFRAGGDQAWIGLARHRERAREALAAIDEAREHLRDDERLELAAFALGVAEARLGEITGRSALGPVGEEVLAEIFARFCIGK